MNVKSARLIQLYFSKLERRERHHDNAGEENEKTHHCFTHKLELRSGMDFCQDSFISAA
ncbi:hypothetical protein [Simkania sp.]|uniref:hypothetical protein n=1 Tax=Simkania sp. TaxID=34094 RepID=UPI003B51D383